MVSKETAFSQIKESGNLTTLPEILLKLLSICENENPTVTEMADIISHDPVLCARVLQLANSAYYGFRDPYCTIDQVIGHLGINAIKNLAVTMSIHQVRGNNHLDPAMFWYRSLLCACIAEKLARYEGNTSTDEAYLAGLLHNIGQLTLATAFPAQFAAIAANAKNSAADLLILEEQLFGMHHCEAGARLVRDWNVNPLIADAILCHHLPLAKIEEAFPLVKIVYTANALTRNVIDSTSGYDIGTVLLKIGRQELGKMSMEAKTEVDTIALNMSIQLSINSFKENLPHNVQENSNAGQARPVVSGANPSENSNREEPHRKSVQDKIAARVTNFALLSSFLEDLTEADDIQAVLAAFEKSVNILLGTGNTLFFFPDDSGVLLKGETSSRNILHNMCHSLTLPVNQSTSRIVQAFSRSGQSGYISGKEGDNSLADRQILSLLRCETAMYFPLTVKTQTIGVVVLGLPLHQDSLSENDFQLARSLTQQTALALQVEKIKEQREKEIHSERMEAISVTARKFAHEINNPLGIIANYLAAIKIKLGQDQNLQEDLDTVDEEIRRISKMVSQMQMFSQAPFADFEPVDINQVAADLIRIAKTSFFDYPQPNISFEPGSDIPPIITSKDAVKQILINLVKNAAEAVPPHERITVSTVKCSGTDTLDQHHIRIIVSDTGPGLSDVVKNNLFKPFVTTKQNGHSGLGLSVVHKTVNDIGGKISCSSEPGHGTTFTIALPLKASKPLTGRIE